MKIFLKNFNTLSFQDNYLPFLKLLTKFTLLLIRIKQQNIFKKEKI